MRPPLNLVRRARLAGIATTLAMVSLAGAQAAELQAYAGAVGGITVATGGGPFACATSGPTIGRGWFAGLSLPTEGFAGCSLGGGIVDKTAASGPLTAQQSVTAPVSGGSFTGQASTRADYGRLGVAASGSMTGTTSSSTYHQAAAFARFQDTLTLSAPGIAPGTAGSIDFAFLIEGMLQSLPHAPFTQQADVALGIRVGTGVGNAARAPWFSFMGTVVNDGTPYLRGGGTGLPGSFVVAPGSFSGSAEVLSTANFGFTWGEPFEVEVAFLTSLAPCCSGASLASSFLSTAQLSGITARVGGSAIGGFTVTSASGTGYGPQGLLPVPEPATLALWAGGLLLLGLRLARPGLGRRAGQFSL